MKSILTGVLVLVAVLIGCGLFVASGMYHIGADEPHWPLTARALDLLRNRSVATHARGIAVPDLNNSELLAKGARHYAAMCEGCHRAPGKEESELRVGLYPYPPNLLEHGIQDPAEAFWTIKHGVKLSAMPAWGKTHNDEAIWGLVAFVEKLPDLSPTQYQEMASGEGEPSQHDTDDMEDMEKKPHEDSHDAN